MTEYHIFGEPEIPIIIRTKINNRKGTKKEALYDERTKKYLTKWVETSFDPGRSNEHFRWWHNSKGKYLLIETPEYQLLFIRYELKLKFEGNGRLSWMSGRPNNKYIVRSGNDNREYMIDINTGEAVTEKHSAIYPAPKFPQNPYYKASKIEGNRGEAIFHFPSGEQMTEYYDDISSVGVGVLGGKNDYYITNRYSEPRLWKAWREEVAYGIEYKDLEKITRDLKGMLDNYKLVRNVFEELG